MKEVYLLNLRKCNSLYDDNIHNMKKCRYEDVILCVYLKEPTQKDILNNHLISFTKPLGVFSQLDICKHIKELLNDSYTIVSYENLEYYTVIKEVNGIDIEFHLNDEPKGYSLRKMSIDNSLYDELKKQSENTPILDITLTEMGNKKGQKYEVLKGIDKKHDNDYYHRDILVFNN